MLKKLPIGIQTFSELIEGGYLYIDKTPLIHELITLGKTYFLSRPRRFGKSLLLSTLKAVFEGQKALFANLWIAQTDYNWPKFPIIQISFGGAQYENSETLRSFLHLQLDKIIESYQLNRNFSERAEFKFRQVIEDLSKQGKVVILIDEYDKPILDTIDDLELAKANQETLKAFYSVIKEVDEYIKFVFITGVSKFAKTGVFSGLNNLNDISMDTAYASLCGYTQEELELAFSDYLIQVSNSLSIAQELLLEQIKFWYNGYRFSSSELRVYNPFSTLLFFKKQEFVAHWFETGTPTFLINLIKNNHYQVQNWEHLIIDQLSFGSYEIEKLQIIPLLFQTGYLTIVDYLSDDRLFVLDYPNYEVEQSFKLWLLDAFSYVDKELASSHLYYLTQALKQNNLDAFFTQLKVFFANIPYDLQISREQYYQTVFHLILTMLGMRLESEVKTADGRIDAVLQTATDIYVFEFKLNGSAAEALQQIIDKQYALKYQTTGKPIHQVGVEFNHETRNVGKWEISIL